jgi:hypothetical protein
VFHGADNEVAGVEYQFAGALTFDLDNQTGISCLNDDLVVQAQRQPEAVEARTKVGAGGGNDRTAQQPGSQH